MNPHLLFNFSVNKENNSINVNREFAAGLDLVWDAWTKPELLDLWWAPKPYQTKTKKMDFREGGLWLYSMHSPENAVHWSRVDFKKIEHKKSFSGLNAFCDEDGKLNEDFQHMLWTNIFSGKGDTTIVDISLKFDSLADLEKLIDMGFKEGFTMAMENLDQYIEAQFKLNLA